MKVEGAADIQRRLRDLAQQAAGDAQQALLSGAEPLRQRVSDLARRAPGAPDLADHIAISLDGEAVAIGPTTEERSDQPGRRFDEQGEKLEYGTRHMPAFPFMRPAFDGDSDAAAEGILERLWRRLTERLG